MACLVLLDRDQYRADAIRAAAFTDEGHEFVLDTIDSDGLLLDLHSPVVVVAKCQLVLHEPVTANGFPVVVAHSPLQSPDGTACREAWYRGAAKRCPFVRSISATERE